MQGIHCVRTFAEFNRLAVAWEGLRSQATGSSIFVSHEFLCAWLRSYGSGVEPYVLVARAGDALVGALPMCIGRTRTGRRALRFMGDGYADYSDVLVRGDSPAAADSLVEAFLQRHGEWDFAHLRYLDSESHLLRLLNPRHHPSWLIDGRTRMPSPYVRVVGKWPAHVNGRFRRELNRRRRKLEKAHAAITVSWGATPAEVSSGLEVFYRLHRLRWESMKGSISNYSIADTRRRHADMFTELAQRHRTLLATLSVGKRPIAVAVNLLDGDTVYYCQPAFDPEFAEYSPSNQLIAELIDYCDTHGAKVLDFLRGDEEYKYRWTDTSRTLSEIWLSRPGLVNAAMACWTLDLRGHLRETPIMGRGIITGRWLAKRLTSPRSS